MLSTAIPAGAAFNGRVEWARKFLRTNTLFSLMKDMFNRCGSRFSPFLMKGSRHRRIRLQPEPMALRSASSVTARSSIPRPNRRYRNLGLVINN